MKKNKNLITYIYYELKLEKWRNDFNATTKNIKAEFNDFFKGKKLDDCYSLRLDQSSEYVIEANIMLPILLK